LRRLAHVLGIVAAGIFASPGTAGADPTSSPSPAPSLPPQIGHVSTAERHDVPLDSTPKRTYVVDHRTIQAYGMRDVADALRFVPGVFSFAYGGAGAQTEYGILGASSSQTLVLLNGVPIADPAPGSVDLSTLSTVGVTRIEVVESAGSTLYGSSAVGGIINLITGPETGASVSAGSLNDRDVRLSLAKGRLDLGLERHLTGNAYGYPAQEGYPPGTRTNADAETSALRAGYRAGDVRHVEATAQAYVDVAHLGVPGGLDFPSPAARQDAARTIVSASLRRAGAMADTSLTASVTTRRLFYDDPASGPQSDTNTSRSRLAFKRVSTAAFGSLVLGLDLASETALIAPVPDLRTAARESSSAVYAQYDERLGARLLVEAGLRAENDAAQGRALLPSIGFVAELGKLRLRASHGTSFRVPTLDELYYPGFGNPALVPERSVSTDGSLGTAGDAAVSVGYFARDSVNLVATLSNGNRFYPANIAQASVRGVRVDAHTTPAARSGVVASFGIVDTYRAQNLSPGSAATRLAFTPVLDVLLGLDRPLGRTGFGAGATVRVQGPHLETNVLRGGQSVVDAYVRRHLASGIVTLRWRDLGDERFMAIRGYPVPGRTVELEFSVR